jgi:hypothetical protein
MAVLALAIPAAHAEKKNVAPTQTWKGSVDDDALSKDAPVCIVNGADLGKLWQAWKIADKAPEVDFSKEIVIVQTTKGSILNPSFRLDEKGNLEILGMATMDYLPGFRYVICSVPRDGVKTVDGKEPLPAK